MAVLDLIIMITFLKTKDMPCCVAVPGTTILKTAVLRPAATPIGRSASSSTTMLVFVLSARLGELFSSPLYFSSFALCTCSFFLLYKN